MKKYYARPWMNQYWCMNEITGEVLLINHKDPDKEYKYHYNGDGHIFFKRNDTFNQDGAKKISEKEWLKILESHLARLKSF